MNPLKSIGGTIIGGIVLAVILVLVTKGNHIAGAAESSSRGAVGWGGVKEDRVLALSVVPGFVEQTHHQGLCAVRRAGGKRHVQNVVSKRVNKRVGVGDVRIGVGQDAGPTEC